MGSRDFRERAVSLDPNRAFLRWRNLWESSEKNGFVSHASEPEMARETVERALVLERTIAGRRRRLRQLLESEVMARARSQISLVTHTHTHVHKITQSKCNRLPESSVSVEFRLLPHRPDPVIYHQRNEYVLAECAAASADNCGCVGWGWDPC